MQACAPRVALRDARIAHRRGLQSLKDDIKDKSGELAKMMESKHYTDSELCLFKLILEELCTVGGKGKNGM